MRFGTLVHGDVKSANIVFNRGPQPASQRTSRGKRASRKPDRESQPPMPLQCALYDLQYVGLGLPTLDLVYFLGTSVHPALLTPSTEKELLQAYYGAFVEAVPSMSRSHESYTFEIFWRHWELSIVDWYRSMAGWGLWGNDAWVTSRAREIVERWCSSDFDELQESL